MVLDGDVRRPTMELGRLSYGKSVAICRTHMNVSMPVRQGHSREVRHIRHGEFYLGSLAAGVTVDSFLPFS